MALVPVTSEASSYYEISEKEAIKVQNKLIKEWKPQREVLTLRYGEHMAGLIAGATGMLINSIFRKNLKLRHHGAIFTTIALTATPGFIASMNHNYLVTNPILLYENSCSTCLYSTASLSVNFCGVLFPLIASPTINLAIASTLGYRVPYIYEVREICKFWWSAVKPRSNFLLLSLVANAIMINIIVYKQMQTMDRVTDIILKIEQAINDGLISLETITQ